MSEKRAAEGAPEVAEKKAKHEEEEEEDLAEEEDLDEEEEGDEGEEEEDDEGMSGDSGVRGILSIFFLIREGAYLKGVWGNLLGGIMRNIDFRVY